MFYRIAIFAANANKKRDILGHVELVMIAIYHILIDLCFKDIFLKMVYNWA